MKYLLCLLLINSVICDLSAQVTIDWSVFNTTLGTGGLSLQKDDDNRLYVYSESPCRLIRYNTEGDTIWSRIPSYQIISMDLDTEGNILTLGRTYVSGSGYYWTFNKWDSIGNVLWTQQIGPSTYHDPKQIKTDQFNNVYVTGIGQMKYTIAKYFPNGVQDWIYAHPTIDINGENCGYDIEVTDTTQVYTVGKHGYNMFLIKLNDMGDTLWTKKFRRNIWMGIPTYSNDQGRIIRSDSMGNVYIQNKTLSEGHTQTIKYNPNGVRLWVQEHNPMLMATHADLLVEPDGTNYFFGHSYYTPIPSRIKVDKRNSNGDIMYSFEYVNPDGRETMAFGGYLKDGNAYVCGRTTSCNGCDELIVVLKVNSSGILEWDHLNDTEAYSINDVALSLVVDQEDAVYVTGKGAPVNQYYVHTFKLFECNNIDFEANLSNDTIWANSSGNLYRWLNCNNNFSPLTGWNSNNYFVPSTLGSFAVITKKGTCIDTSECIVNGYQINDYENVCYGSNYIFADGYEVTNLTSQINHISYLTSSTGLDSVISMNLYLYAQVDVNVNQNQNTLTSTATSVQYQWVDCLNNYSFIAGQTNATFTSPIDGEFAVIITQNSCVDTSICYEVNFWSVEELHNEHNLLIYPNPTAGKINIADLLDHNFKRIELYDLLGRKLKEFPTEVYTMDISEFENGKYLLHLSDVDRTYTILVVKWSDK